jgi:hypothetical protein
MPAGSHRQPLRNPTDRDRGLRPELGGEVDLEGVTLAPRSKLSFRNPAGSQGLRDKALCLGLGRLGLKPHGRAFFWSARPEPAFAQRLARAGFDVRVVAAPLYASPSLRVISSVLRS